MSLKHVKNMTEEERQALQDKMQAGREARAEQIALWKTQPHYLTKWSDMPYWESLARKHSVRLPPDYIPSTEVKYVRRVMKKLGVDSVWYKDHNGCTYQEMCQLNPTMSARALCGLMLEDYEND